MKLKNIELGMEVVAKVDSKTAWVKAGSVVTVESVAFIDTDLNVRVAYGSFSVWYNHKDLRKLKKGELSES